MKFKIILKSLIAGLIIMLAFTNVTAQKDSVPASHLPPGSITPANAPMFVIIGWDDNMFADGENWIRNFIKDKKNANGTPARNTFFLIGNGGDTTFYDDGNGHQTAMNVLAAWKNLYYDGHEIGDHTMNHPDGGALGYTETQWQNTIDSCKKFVNVKVGVPLNQIKGFRDPFLDYNCGLFDAYKSMDFLYDCAIEWGYNNFSGGGTDPVTDPATWNASDTNTWKYGLYWPYTLDNGPAPGSSALCNTIQNQGLWEFNVHAYFNTGCTGKTVGFDYNLWSGGNGIQPLLGDTFFNYIKYDFDLRHRGNKVPFMLDAHPDNYTDWNSAASAYTNSTTATRRKAIQDFINYVLQFQDVRLITFTDLIKWMRNPKPWQNDNTGPYTLNVIDSNGTVTVNPQKAQYNKGDTVSLTAMPNSNYVFTGWGGVPSGDTSNTISIIMNYNMNVFSIFKYQPPSCSNTLDFLANSVWVSDQDTYGSTITATSIPGKVSYNWTEPPTSDTTSPWVDLTGTLSSGTMKGACGITITYKSNQPLALSLDQANITDYSNYLVILQPSVNDTTVTVDISDFMQPNWHLVTQPLELDSINQISVDPSLGNRTVNLNGSVEITSIVIHGLGTPQGIHELSQESMNIYKIQNGNLNITTSDPGTYNLFIYSAEGKLISSEKINLSEGSNIVDMDSNLSAGIYVIKVAGEKVSTVKKIVLTK